MEPVFVISGSVTCRNILCKTAGVYGFAVQTATTRAISFQNHRNIVLPFSLMHCVNWDRNIKNINDLKISSHICLVTMCFSMWLFLNALVEVG